MFFGFQEIERLVTIKLKLTQVSSLRTSHTEHKYLGIEFTDLEGFPRTYHVKALVIPFWKALTLTFLYSLVTAASQTNLAYSLTARYRCRRVKWIDGLICQGIPPFTV